jgi:hypothetical protein
MPFRLLVETPAPKEEFEYIFEEKNSREPATLFIKGPYMMAEGVNKNNRIYSIDEMKREVNRYTNEMIKTKRSIGELNHPTTPDINLERACHMITEITQEGNVFYGKSKVLSTPCGQIVTSLVRDGVGIGVSTRSMGQVVKCEQTGIDRVKDMRLVAVDCVADPSFPKAFVNGILESKQFVLRTDGTYEELYNIFENAISRLPKKDVDNYLRDHIMSFIRKIGS